MEGTRRSRPTLSSVAKRTALLFVAIVATYALVVVWLEARPQNSTETEQPSPAEEETRAEAERVREDLLDACLKAADFGYTIRWDAECERHGKEQGCAVPDDLAASWDLERRQGWDACHRRYPAAQER